ncbi:hypothetical protein SAMN05720781_0465 [Fibrobacter sp. UWT3]|nr:hypothetical protein SAMN05720781_0465 [Fibrobacter sp. UWT3]
MLGDPRRSQPLLVLSKAEASKAEWAGKTNEKMPACAGMTAGRAGMTKGLRRCLFFRGLPLQFDHFLLRELGDTDNHFNGEAFGQHRESDILFSL